VAGFFILTYSLLTFVVFLTIHHRFPNNFFKKYLFS
jgi:hypothetical protein